MILKRQSHNKDVFRSINISFKLLLSTRQQPTLDPEVSLPQVKLNFLDSQEILRPYTGHISPTQQRGIWDQLSHFEIKI